MQERLWQQRCYCCRCISVFVYSSTPANNEALTLPSCVLSCVLFYWFWIVQKQNFRKRARELKEQELSSRKRIITGSSRGTKGNPKGNSMQRMTPPHFNSTASSTSSHSSSRLPTASGSSSSRISSSSAKASIAAGSGSSSNISGSGSSKPPAHYTDTKAPPMVSVLCA
jgi:hypothetical protein